MEENEDEEEFDGPFGIDLAVHTTNPDYFPVCFRVIYELNESVAEALGLGIDDDSLGWEVWDSAEGLGFEVELYFDDNEPLLKFVVVVPSNSGEQFMYQGRTIETNDLLAEILTRICV